MLNSDLYSSLFSYPLYPHTPHNSHTTHMTALSNNDYSSTLARSTKYYIIIYNLVRAMREPILNETHFQHIPMFVFNSLTFEFTQTISK